MRSAQDTIEKRLTYDGLKTIAFDGALAESLVSEMRFMQGLLETARAGRR